MEKKTIILIFVSCALIVAIGYIITDKVSICEQSKNESYILGFNAGVEQWNAAVIYNVNTNGKIPYWFNGTYHELPINLGGSADTSTNGK